jgi:hypothetical protein
MAEVASPQVGAARPRPRPLVVSPAHCPSSSLLLALWVFWQNRIFAIFSGFFPESWISAQKQDTKAILLKTTLVRISCIQNTQIRGETIAKVFGKVDTFWTYQLQQGYLMSMHASVLVDNVGPPSAEVCRTATSFP